MFKPILATLALTLSLAACGADTVQEDVTVDAVTSAAERPIQLQQGAWFATIGEERQAWWVSGGSEPTVSFWYGDEYIRGMPLPAGEIGGLRIDAVVIDPELLVGQLAVDDGEPIDVEACYID